MKKLSFLLLLMPAFAFFSFNDPGPIVGQWEWKRTLNSGPFHLLLVFRTDSTCEGFANGTSFASGRYYMKGDTLWVADPICQLAYFGSYRLKFYGQDSVLMSVVSDTCKGRVEGMSGRTFLKAGSSSK